MENLVKLFVSTYKWITKTKAAVGIALDYAFRDKSKQLLVRLYSYTVAGYRKLCDRLGIELRLNLLGQIDV